MSYTALELKLTASTLRERSRIRSKPEIFQRGISLFSGGAVQQTDARAAELAGVVSSSDRSSNYRVKIVVPDRGELETMCECPYNENGKCCKHAVALGLSFLAATGYWPETPATPPAVPYLADPDILILEGSGVCAREKLAVAAIEALAHDLNRYPQCHDWEIDQQGATVRARLYVHDDDEDARDTLEEWLDTFAGPGAFTISRIK